MFFPSPKDTSNVFNPSEFACNDCCSGSGSGGAIVVPGGGVYLAAANVFTNTNTFQTIVPANNTYANGSTLSPWERLYALGIACRSGISGLFSGNRFNINWTGTVAELWIDNTNLGTIQTSTSSSTVGTYTAIPLGYNLLYTGPVNLLGFFITQRTSSTSGANITIYDGLDFNAPVVIGPQCQLNTDSANTSKYISMWYNMPMKLNTGLYVFFSAGTPGPYGTIVYQPL